MVADTVDFVQEDTIEVVRSIELTGDLFADELLDIPLLLEKVLVIDGCNKRRV